MMILFLVLYNNGDKSIIVKQSKYVCNNDKTFQYYHENHGHVHINFCFKKLKWQLRNESVTCTEEIDFSISEDEILALENEMLVSDDNESGNESEAVCR